MKVTESTPAVLLLQDGTLFHGKALGKIGTHGGEICFNTGMTGYQEIYTDPSYSGQVIINTTAHIGNYGVIDGLEAESDQVQIAGMVCNEFARIHSRETADGSLQDYLEKANLVGISGIDTPEAKQLCNDANGKAYRCGQVAANALAALIGRQTVSCVKVDIDRYKRIAATCSVADGDLGRYMVARGLAVA